MELTDRWKAMNWQASEFSYAKADLLADLKKESKSAITQLLNAYKRTYAFLLAFTISVPFLALLKPNDPSFVLSIGLIWTYGLILSVFFTVKLIRFNLPDLSLQTAEAIRASLAFVRSINAFQADFVALFAPIVFLGSLFGTLTYKGRTITSILQDPLALGIIVGSTLLILLGSKTLRTFMMRHQCGALIAKLEEHLHSLEQP